jgi:hypothetical protein
MATPTKKLSSALSLSDLDNQYNPNVIVPAKIKAALAKLGDNAMTSINFQKEAGVTTLQLSQFSEQFESFQVVVRDNGKPKTLWCGSESFAKKVKERLGV